MVNPKINVCSSGASGNSLAAAPMAKKRARIAAAVGVDTGNPPAFPENKSMMRPMKNGIESDTLEEIQS